MSIELAELERPLADVLPEGWREAVLSDVADVNPETLRASTSPDYTFGYIDISQIEAPGQCAGWTEHTFGDAPSRARRKVQAGDILVSTVRPYLRSFAQVPEADLPLVASTGFAVVRAGANADQQFLYQHILHSSFIEHLTPRMTGSNYPAVSAGDVEVYPILLPPVAEQRRIAEVLRSVDEAIAAASLVIAQADEAFEAVLADLFSCYGDASAKLESYCLTGGLQTGPFGSQLKAEDYVDEGIPVVMPVDLTPKGMDFAAAKKAPVAKSRELARHILQPGDVLFARRGEIGRCGLYLEGDPVAMCGTGCLRARLDTAKIDPALAYFLIQSRQARDWLRAHAVGATMPNLNTTIIGELPMPDIPKGEQGAWVDALLMIEGSRRINQSTLASYQIAKSTLMSDLLSGQVRVPA